MISVGLSHGEVQTYLDQVFGQFNSPGLTVGCINGPASVTITGDENQINALRILMSDKKIYAQKLSVNVAYHSSHMNEIASQYRLLLKDITGGRPGPQGTSTMVSSVTGTAVSLEELSNNEYWVQNLVSPVKFSDAVSLVCSQSHKTRAKKLGAREKNLLVDEFIEIGPHSALQRPIREILKMSPGTQGITYGSLLVRNISASTTTLEMIGRLHCSGYPVNISEVNAAEIADGVHRMILPNLPEYPFNHSQTYWLESRLSSEYRFRQHSRNILLGSIMPGSSPLERRWRNVIKRSENPWIEDHKVRTSTLTSCFRF